MTEVANNFIVRLVVCIYKFKYYFLLMTLGVDLGTR
jgi:hypothetical protein